ncbi:MAG: hypothetical protein KH544_02750 [Firmicutes bacterium]|nr:hypothetical protein [Bacillota bacterium]
MSIKRLTIRFNLQNEEERRAWEYLHSRDGPSLSKDVIRILNAAEQYEDLQMLIRQTITEALQGATVPASLPAMAESAGSTENDTVMLDLLDSFL